MTQNQPHALLIIFAGQTRYVSEPALIASTGEMDACVIEDGILKAKDHIEQWSKPPLYIAIDIGDRREDVLEELDILAQACDAKTRVVVVGSVNDIHFYRALIERGVVEYYPAPCSVELVAASLVKQQSAIKPAKKSMDRKGFSVGFMSAASGDGASTVALNTAYCLANQFNHSVVLVDLDYQFGMIARHLDLKAPYGIRELLEHPDRGVDAALLNKMLVPYGRNLSIVAAPSELRKLPNVRPEQIVELLDVLRSQFDFVLFDIQHVWVNWIASLLSKLDHNVVATQLWLRSLTHVTRIMACWQSMGIDSQNVSLVMNRSGSRFKEAMSVADFERVSGLGIAFSLPNDTKAIVASENRGKTIMELGNSELEQGIEQIAAYLHNRYTGESVTVVNQKKKKGLLDIFQ